MPWGKTKISHKTRYTFCLQFVLFWTFCSFLVTSDCRAVEGGIEGVKCELAHLSDRRHQWYTEGVNRSKQLIAAGTVPGYLTRMKAHYVDRELPILVPTRESLDDPEFKTYLDGTIGILWRDTRNVGEALGHSYIRVGNRIYDLQMKGVEAHDFYAMMQNRFKYHFGILGRDGQAPYYETTFPISEEAKKELFRFFEHRAQGTPTIDGVRRDVHWQSGVEGYERHDGVICENCASFAQSFRQPRWWADYPGLRKAVLDTGILGSNVGANSALQLLYDPNAHVAGFISWGGPGPLREQHRIIESTQWGQQITEESPK